MTTINKTNKNLIESEKEIQNIIKNNQSIFPEHIIKEVSFTIAIGASNFRFERKEIDLRIIQENENFLSNFENFDNNLFFDIRIKVFSISISQLLIIQMIRMYHMIEKIQKIKKSRFIKYGGMYQRLMHAYRSQMRKIIMTRQLINYISYTDKSKESLLNLTIYIFLKWCLSLMLSLMLMIICFGGYSTLSN
jgi:hypothetical protein